MHSAPTTEADTPLTLRSFQNADAAAVAELVTAGVRGHWQYRPEHFRESGDPHKVRFVAERGGQLLATASFSPFGDGAPDALRLELAGAAAALSPLYLRLLADLPHGFGRLLGVTREDFGEKMAFFAAAGFRNAWQSWGAHLDLTRFDFEPYRPLEEKLYLAGYELALLGNPEAASSDTDWDAFYQLHRASEADVPRNPTTTPERLGSAELRQMVAQEEAAFVVRYRGEIVALTRLTLGDKKARGLAGPREVESEFTATHPQHRSRGLATLLKAYALAWAGAQGSAYAGTGGNVLNLPMLRVNTRLGYEVERMWVTWEYCLR